MRLRVPALDQSDCSVCYNYDQNNNTLSTKDIALGPKNYFAYAFNALRTSKREQPLYKEQKS